MTCQHIAPTDEHGRCERCGHVTREGVRTGEELLDSPIAQTIDRIQSEGEVDIFIEGWNAAGTHCLIVQPNNSSPDGGTVTVAAFAACNGIGRWECSVKHWRDHTDLYRERFPRFPTEEGMWHLLCPEPLDEGALWTDREYVAWLTCR